MDKIQEIKDKMDMMFAEGKEANEVSEIIFNQYPMGDIAAFMQWDINNKIQEYQREMKEMNESSGTNEKVQDIT